MAKRKQSPRKSSKAPKASKSLPMLMLGFVVRVLVAVFRKRSEGSGRAPRRPAGRGNTGPGAAHLPSPAAQRTKERQKATRRSDSPQAVAAPAAPAKVRTRRGEHPITALQRQGAEGHWIQGEGVIVKNLPDDLEGSRHQRFLVELSDGHVIKVSHNIDLAARVPADEGDLLRFAGDFESNDLGGALHWTHLDPRKWHADGWIEHDGRRYE